MINDQSIENIIVIRTEYHFCRRPSANYVFLYLNGQIKKSMSYNLLVTSITLSVGLLAHRAPGERHHEKSWIWNRWKNGKLYLQIDSGCSAWSRGCATRKSSSQPWEVANRPQPSNGTFYIEYSANCFQIHTEPSHGDSGHSRLQWGHKSLLVECSHCSTTPARHLSSARERCLYQQISSDLHPPAWYSTHPCHSQDLQYISHCTPLHTYQIHCSSLSLSSLARCRTCRR